MLRTVPQRRRELYPWLVEKFHQEMRPQLTVSSLCIMNTQLPRLIIYTAHPNKQSLAWLHYRREFQLIHVVLQSVLVRELIFPSVKNNYNKCITRHSTLEPSMKTVTHYSASLWVLLCNKIN